MSVIVCASCQEYVDTDHEPDAAASMLCPACDLLRYNCKECGEQCVDPDEEDPPAKRPTCRTCHAIGRADHERDVAKDRRLEREA